MIKKYIVIICCFLFVIPLNTKSQHIDGQNMTISGNIKAFLIFAEVPGGNDMTCPNQSNYWTSGNMPPCAGEITQNIEDYINSAAIGNLTVDVDYCPFLVSVTYPFYGIYGVADVLDYIHNINPPCSTRGI